MDRAEARATGPVTAAGVAVGYGYAKRHGVLVDVDAAQARVRHRGLPDPRVLAELTRTLARPLQLERLDDAEFERQLTRRYGDTGPGGAQAMMQDLGEDIDLAAAASALPEPEDLLESQDDAPIIRLINAILAQAVREGASDVHIEPFEGRLSVRLRVDGTLREILEPPRALAGTIVSRIKVMARLDIAEKRLPQDGRISLRVAGHPVDVRVSTLPSGHGERVVLRLLDRQAGRLDLGGLGMDPDTRARLQRLIRQPHGILLVTGPTGSGKTTTLYTGLLGLNSIARKVITVEDPIEYQLSGINQIQVRPQIGLNFASLLRSILRQDPDVIMVGEIRDLETAEIAVQAALTGHLVLSTLHTNSAAATVTRLRDMGLEDYLLTAVLRGILAQRLVRRLCTECRHEVPAADALVARFGLERRTTRRPITLWHAGGCAACRNTGFRGRQAIAEFLIPDAQVERLIFSRADHTAIEQAAIAGGMVTMFDAGVEAALAGTTTLEEVVRSIRADA